MKNKWVPVASLVGKDIKGKRAVISQPQHHEMLARHNEKPKVRTLTKAEYVNEKGHKWLYIRWELEDGDFSCPYSGWREDHQGPTPVVQFI